MDFQHAIFETKPFPTYLYFEVNTNALSLITETVIIKCQKSN